MTAPDLLRQLADCMEAREQLEAEVATLKAELAAVKQLVSSDESPWLSTKQAARFIGRSVSFLAKNSSISFRKYGYRTKRYHRDDLQRFLDTRKPRKGASHES